MAIINLIEAKANLSKIIARALKGEEIIIAKAGKPLVTLTPYKKKDLTSFLGDHLSGMSHILDNSDDTTSDFTAMFSEGDDGGCSDCD